MDETDGMTPLTILERWKRDRLNHGEGISERGGSHGL